MQVIALQRTCVTGKTATNHCIRLHAMIALGNASGGWKNTSLRLFLKSPLRIFTQKV